MTKKCKENDYGLPDSFCDIIGIILLKCWVIADSDDEDDEDS